jgi:ubiquitin carboxyl-terminal hydrolase L5
VEKNLLNLAEELFSPQENHPSSGNSRSPVLFSRTFASDNLHRSRTILQNTDPLDLLQQLKLCIQNAAIARKEMEGEVEKMHAIAVQNEKRCHDYEPFVKEYLAALMREGALEECLAKAG